MKRAAVIIGVNNYPAGSDLPQLQAGTSAAKEFIEWATGMGFDVYPLLDDDEPVTVRRIYDAVDTIVSRSGVHQIEQLLVYFSGHGINRGFAEYWLLSQAPRNLSEAVNVNASVDMARYMTGINHVVFISDACRTAAASINEQSISGSCIFPSRPGTFPSSTVDRFYATHPGHPSLEVRSPLGAASDFRAVYTDCLLYALNGNDRSLADSHTVNGVPVAIVTPTKLKPYLATAVPRRLSELKVTRPQNPDAIIESAFPAYLSMFPKAGASESAPPPAPSDPIEDFSSRILSRSRGSIARLNEVLVDAPSGVGSDVSKRAALIQTSIETVGFEDLCGFAIYVNGRDRVTGALSHTAMCKISDAPKDRPYVQTVRVTDRAGEIKRQSHTVLLELASGRAMVLGALHGYVGSVLINDQELVNVSYEPAADSPQWQKYSIGVDLVRRDRALIAAASREGSFRVNSLSASQLSQRLRTRERLDPTLSLYAAYAFHEAGLLDAARSVADHMSKAIGAVLFDILLLSSKPGSGWKKDGPSIAPACPLLSRGWTLLDSRDAQLTAAMREAQRDLLPSFWTLFGKEGASVLAESIAKGKPI